MLKRKLVATLVVALLTACTFSACSSDSDSGSSGAGCSNSLPAGSFAKSCSGCTMEGSVLSCTGCGDGAGANPSAKIDTCSCASADATQGISNNHGVLTCGSSGPTAGAKCSPGSGECKNCSCGQSCFPTAVCSTCEARCGYSCTTDQDCVDLQAKYNLTVSYSRCVKTSPGHEIYKCE